MIKVNNLMCKDEMMECVLCHKKELSKTRCEQGHYVCNECHTKGMDVIIDICLSETSKNPIEIIRRMMAQPFCHMHGPEQSCYGWFSTSYRI